MEKFALTLASALFAVPCGCGSPDNRDGDGGETQTSSSGTDGSSQTSSMMTTEFGDSDPDTTGRVEISHGIDIQPIWDQSCSCHIDRSDGGLNLRRGNAFTELLAGRSAQATMRLVVPGEPSASYLWHKLYGTQDDVGGSGSAMPQGSGLIRNELDLVERWILEGAAP